ncbi:MAG: NAD(P)H-dependent oxidoreductase [Polyangiaceae bacterium]|nr:NAD(P)H-dependent oxidoreductase [Polyangiaceae bacterium]
MSELLKVACVCGSLQAESGNLRLLKLARELAPHPLELEIFDGLGSLPHFNPDLDASTLESVSVWRQCLRSSLVVLVACPEYGHSLPGVVKNAVDWVIGSGELEGKPVAVTASTPSLERGRRGIKALTDTLGAVSAQVLWDTPIARGDAQAASVRELLSCLLAAARREQEHPGSLLARL